jgi:proline iminopeptidase
MLMLVHGQTLGFSLNSCKSKHLMGAKYDEMSPEDLQKMADSMPNARAWISENGSHMAMYDDQIPYFWKLLRFLKSA